MKVCQVCWVVLGVLIFISRAAADLPVTVVKNCATKNFYQSSDYNNIISVEDAQLLENPDAQLEQVIAKGTIFAAGQIFSHKGEKFLEIMPSDKCVSGYVKRSAFKILNDDEFEEALDSLYEIDRSDVERLKNISFDELLEEVPPQHFLAPIALLGEGLSDGMYYGYVISDASAYTYKGEMSPGKLLKGSVIQIRTSNDFDYGSGFKGRYFYAAGINNASVIPNSAVRMLKSDQEVGKIIDILYPVLERTGSAVSWSDMYRKPDESLGEVNGQVTDKQDREYEIMRRTIDGNWYMIRYWLDSRGTWITGFVQSRVFKLDPTPEELAAAAEEKRIKDEAAHQEWLVEAAKQAKIAEQKREREKVRIAEDQKRITEEKERQALEAEEKRLTDLEKKKTAKKVYFGAGIAYLIFFIGAFFFPAYRFFALEKWMTYYDRLHELVGSPRGFPALLAVSFVAFGLAVYLYFLEIYNYVFFVCAAFGLLAGCILFVAAVGSFWTAFLLPGLFITLWANLQFLLSTRDETFEEVPLGDQAEDEMSSAEYRWRKYQYDRQHEYYESRANARNSEAKDSVYDKVNEKWKKQAS